MYMLTTAVVMSVGSAEQTSVRAVSSDRVEIEGMSFAKSFDERAALTVAAEVKTSAGKGAGELLDAKTGVPPKISDDELVAALGAVKGKAIAGQVVTSEPEENKSASVVKSLDVAAIVSGGLRVTKTFWIDAAGTKTAAGAKGVDTVQAALDGLQAKTIVGDVSAAQGGAPAGATEEVAGGLPRVQEDASSTAATDAASIPQVSVAVADRPFVSSGGEDHTVQKEIAGAEKTELVTATKKMAKNQESKARTKVPLKVAGPAEIVTSSVAQSFGGLESQAVLSVPVVVPVSVQQNEIGTTPEGRPVGAISAMAGQSAGAAAVAADGKGGKESVRSGRTTGDDAEPVAASPDNAVASLKIGSELKKAAGLALPAEEDGGAKTKGTVAHTASEHALAGTVGIVPGLVIGVASVHVDGAATAATLQSSGEVSAHAAAVRGGSGEQAGSGVFATPSMEGTHRTLMATPTALEVGIANGTHGWLKIRAEMAGGGAVNASLSAASPAGQEMLHRELSSLTAYLQQECVAVNTVVVHSAVAGQDSLGLAGGMGGDGQAQQRSGQGGEGRQAGVVSSYADEAVGADGLLSPVTYAGGGSWLSVRA